MRRLGIPCLDGNLQMKLDPRPDSADTKSGERLALDRARVARVLLWLGFLAFGVGLVFLGKALLQPYWR